MSARLRLGVLAALTCLTAAAVVAVPTAASAAAPTLSQAAPLVLTPDQTVPLVFSAKAGEAVAIRCWQDSTNKSPNLRFFYVTMSGSREGFVRADFIPRWQQPRVGNCLTAAFPDIWAADWAVKHLGDTTYYGQCLRFVNDAYKNTTSSLTTWTNGDTTAYQAWQRAGTDGLQKPAIAAPPRGAWVFWSPSAPGKAGHVALSVGNGYVISTYDGVSTDNNVHFASIVSITTASQTYKGYTTGAIP